jgi:hypothetical protein
MAHVAEVDRAPPLPQTLKVTFKICPIIRSNYKFQLKRNPHDSEDIFSLMFLALIYVHVTPNCLCFLRYGSRQKSLPKLQRKKKTKSKKSQKVH